MTKHAELKLMLRRSFSDIVHTTNTLNENQFTTVMTEGKWSIAEIIGHLILSTKAITKALSTPKPMLLSAFGKIDRDEISIEQLMKQYDDVLANGLTAPSQFVYRNATSVGKEKMLSLFTRALDQLIEQLDTWDVSELTIYALPHPALGTLSFREMILFTEFHTRHHHKQIESLAPCHSN